MGSRHAEARFTLVLRHPGALRAMFWPPNELHARRGILHDDYDIEGDIEAVFPVADYLLDRRPSRRTAAPEGPPGRAPAERRPRVGRERARLRGRRTRSSATARRSRTTTTSNEFSPCSRTRRMVYSCAFSVGGRLETAQRQKLEHICRKLRLRPGERLLDIGCGWGALAIHAARHYGVEVLGVTLRRAGRLASGGSVRRGSPTGVASRSATTARSTSRGASTSSSGSGCSSTSPGSAARLLRHACAARARRRLPQPRDRELERRTPRRAGRHS